MREVYIVYLWKNGQNEQRVTFDTQDALYQAKDSLPFYDYVEVVKYYAPDPNLIEVMKESIFYQHHCRG